jgi:hypothetical protein
MPAGISRMVLFWNVFFPTVRGNKTTAIKRLIDFSGFTLQQTENSKLKNPLGD